MKPERIYKMKLLIILVICSNTNVLFDDDNPWFWDEERNPIHSGSRYPYDSDDHKKDPVKDEVDNGERFDSKASNR